MKNTDKLDDKLKDPDVVLFTKLHGCITATRDKSIPLILTTEQYITYRKSRDHLFNRFIDHASQTSVVYIGSKIEDSDIRSILLEIKQIMDVYPRSYIVLPGLKPAEKSFWESRSITCLDMTFEEFLTQINEEIPEKSRILGKAQEEYEHPICKRFIKAGTLLPKLVKDFLYSDAKYIYSELKTTEITAGDFFKGYSRDFSPIIKGYDFKRNISDNILSEVFLIEEEERGSYEEFFLIKGHAGSGKTILSRRIAWDAATVFNKLCLWLDTNIFPDFEALVEIFRLCGERIYLFIDPVHNHKELIQAWLSKAKNGKLPLTIIGSERNHEWNVSCTELFPLVKEEYELQYLKPAEIDKLLDKLKEHKSLGYLEGLDLEKQKEAFTYKAGRQLLVALYETTYGKPFEDIVFDEYTSIASIQAKSMYLSICFLHRLGIPTRAGLISRVHRISFEEFKEKFLNPLEFIVFASDDRKIRDSVYVSRHPIVAEMVFNKILYDEQDRYNEYIRIINALDIGYSSDREAFIRISNAREMMELFKNTTFIREIFKAGYDRVEEDPMLLQQEAIFEMNSKDGNLDKAGELLRKANQINPDNHLIKHSLSEWYLKKAEHAKTELEKTKYRHDSKKISRELTKDETVTAHPYHTLIKIGLDELLEIQKSTDDVTFERKVNEIEKIIETAKQTFPESGAILSEESRLFEYLERNPEAKKALKEAFDSNKGNPFVAIRLAKMYEKDKEPEKGIEVLRESIEIKTYDKFTNFNLAMLLIKYTPENKADIKIHLKRSFTDGDTNYVAQFWYARFLYLENLFNNAKKYFDVLSNAYLDPEVKKEIRGVITENGKPTQFRGVINKKEHSYGFITRDGYQDSIFMYCNDSNESTWEKVGVGNRVIFEIGFCYRGARALNIRKETE